MKKEIISCLFIFEEMNQSEIFAQSLKGGHYAGKQIV